MKSLIRFTALAAALTAAGLPAHADLPLPARTMTSAEIGALSGMPYLDTTNQSFRMAAAVTASAYNKPVQTLGVERATGATVAVYRGAPSTSVPLAPPMPPGNAVLEMQSIGDSAQSWATMTSAGRPYIKATGYGAFTAEATASWHTTVTIPPGAAGKEVAVRFVVPAVSVAGATEQQGQARWRARMRADLLVNGFPAWSTDAVRFTTDPSKISSGQEVIVLQQFGNELAFPTNDENTPLSSGGPNDDTTMGTINGAAPKTTVYLTLGRFTQGTVVDLSMVVRGTAMTVPNSSGGTDNRCKWDNQEDRYFCSRGSVSVDGGTGETPRIYLLP